MGRNFLIQRSIFGLLRCFFLFVFLVLLYLFFFSPFLFFFNIIVSAWEDHSLCPIPQSLIPNPSPALRSPLLSKLTFPLSCPPVPYPKSLSSSPELSPLQADIPSCVPCPQALLRSSQPLTGPNRRRCREDEQLLGTILGEGERGFVLDTRSAQAAKQARISGGGTEPKSCYPRWRRLHRALERGRPLQDSFSRLAEACAEPAVSVERWLGRLDGSRWLSHVKAALTHGLEGGTVLVHGAEGTDSTLLVTALAQLILDPACRTLEGFQGLLEREWIQAGHPFQLRCARSASSHARGKQEAPLFLLFLDCVWQLSRQFPFSLEFGEQLLLTLFDNAYASAYGTFLCNNERERWVKESTHSLWAWLNQPEERHKYLNPLYSHNPLVIWPSVEPQSIQLWELILTWSKMGERAAEFTGRSVRNVFRCSRDVQSKSYERKRIN
uniref:Myotubularin phosphatase domain-containing protein n=1 Tax=Serinus canaria TaxID=9135 RepID=A0A8C9MNM8_SERCA